MKSAGNDIVALAAVDVQRTISPNFHSKFIVPAERELYEQSSALKTVPFYIFVWLLWSVKESAYKYTQRLQPELIFSPSKFIVENIDASAGLFAGAVSFQGRKLFFRSRITDEYVSSIVDDSAPFDSFYHEILKIGRTDSKGQSGAVRELATQKLRSVLKLDGISISKTEAGYPIVMLDGKQLDIALSFAHHDCFVGYSFKI